MIVIGFVCLTLSAFGPQNAANNPV